MALLNPDFSVLDETDSGLDIDALRVVSGGILGLKDPNKAMILITHYQRLLDYIKPDVIHVMFGTDMIARINAEPDFIPGSSFINDLPVLVAHEFAHSIHTYENEDGDLLDPLWREGMAQVVSQVFVPGSPYDSVFMDRLLADKCGRPHIRTWAEKFLADVELGGTEDEQEQMYKKWFGLIGFEQLGANRAGYCLGYHVVLAAFDKHSVEQLMAMGRLDAEPLMRRTLTLMTGQ